MIGTRTLDALMRHTLPRRTGVLLLALLGLQAPAQAQLAGGNGCDWKESAVLAAFPETNARYYTATLPLLPPAGSRVRIEGSYSDTRYFSYQIYDGAYSPVDGLPDYLLVPDAGSSATFPSRTASDPAVAPGGRYTAYIHFAAIPQNRPANSLYTGTAPNATYAHRVVLRTYLENGTVQLPKIVVETPAGDQPLGANPTSAECGAPAPAPLLNLAGLQLNLTSLDLGALFVADRNIPFNVFYGSNQALGELGLNQDTVFMRADIRNNGDVILVRGRAPSFRERSGSTPAVPEVRYWSMCQNDRASTLVVACAADRVTRLDGNGFYNLVIADIGSLRLPANGPYTQLPFGGISNGALIYRQILAAPDFAGSPLRVPAGVSAASVIGDYAPKAIYCSAARVQARINAGDSPAAVYAACVQRR